MFKNQVDVEESPKMTEKKQPVKESDVIKLRKYSRRRKWLALLNAAVGSRKMRTEK